jgi:chromosomal replication initiation ATPase DnaA
VSASGDNTPLQLSLDFPRPAPALDELAVSPSNAGAVARLKQSRDWPIAAMALIGPPQSGLTTLAAAWAGRSGGYHLSPERFESLSPGEVDSLATRNTAIDPAGGLGDEARLLSLINQVGARGGRLLLTANTPPSQWPVYLEDLGSRLRSMPVAEIRAPDDAMIRARLMAACSRYFFRLPEDVANFLVLRLPRNYSLLEHYVQRLAGTVTGSGRDLTLPLAREVLRLELGSDDDDTQEEEG